MHLRRLNCPTSKPRGPGFVVGTQLSGSEGIFSLVASSTSRLIASARDGRSFWRRRQSSTFRKNSSDTRIWNGRSCSSFDGRPGGRRLFVIIAYIVLTKYITTGYTYLQTDVHHLASVGGLQ